MKSHSLPNSRPIYSVYEKERRRRETEKSYFFSNNLAITKKNQIFNFVAEIKLIKLYMESRKSRSQQQN